MKIWCVIKSEWNSTDRVRERKLNALPPSPSFIVFVHEILFIDGWTNFPAIMCDDNLLSKMWVVASFITIALYYNWWNKIGESSGFSSSLPLLSAGIFSRFTRYDTMWCTSQPPLAPRSIVRKSVNNLWRKKKERIQFPLSKQSQSTWHTPNIYEVN